MGYPYILFLYFKYYCKGKKVKQGRGKITIAEIGKSFVKNIEASDFELVNMYIHYFYKVWLKVSNDFLQNLGSNKMYLQ